MLHCLLLLDPFISYLSPPLTLPSAPSVFSLSPALPSQGPLGAQGPDGPTGFPGRRGPPGEKVCHTCQHSALPLALLLSPLCEWGMVVGTYRSNIPYSGKLVREKTFTNFAVFSAKIIFFTNSRKFSPSKVYCYTIPKCMDWASVLTSQVGSMFCTLVVEGSFSSQINH